MGTWGNQGISFQLSCDNVSYCPHTVMESGQAICTVTFLLEPFITEKTKVNSSVEINLGIEAAFRIYTTKAFLATEVYLTL